MFGSVAAAGGAVGLILGEVLTQYLSWRYCLYVNLMFPRSRWRARWRLSAAVARPPARAWTGPAPCSAAPGCSASSSASPRPRRAVDGRTDDGLSLLLGAVLLGGFVVPSGGRGACCCHCG